MQIKYNGCSTVMEYCRKSKAGLLVYPPKPGCKSHGHYERNVVDENGVKHRIKIRRDKIKKPQKESSSTLSRLPHMLCPYHKHPITLMSRIMTLWLRGQRSLTAVLDELSRMYDLKSAEVEHDLVNLTQDQLLGIKKIYEGSLRKYRIWQGLTHSYGLDQFAVLCAGNDHEKILDIDTRYYDANGGRFLFGKAVPLRRPAASSG
jgi:hypothetical protein